MYVEATSLETWSSADRQRGATIEKTPARAIVWLKQNATGMQAQIAAHLRSVSGISSVEYTQQRPTILTICFDFNRIRYAEIISRITPLGYDARVVGY